MISSKTVLPTAALLPAAVLLLTACASSGGAGPGVTQAPEAAEGTAPTAESPVTGSAPASFTSAQADHGRDLFRAQCTECHYSSEFSDSQFKFKWSRRTAGSLYEVIQTSMPETAPGSLSAEEAVALVTYILRLNGFEPGSSELPAEEAVLDAIDLASIRSP